MTYSRLSATLRTAGATLVAATVISAAPAWAGATEQAPGDAVNNATPAVASSTTDSGSAGMRPMQGMAMMEQWKQMDARLDALVDTMHRATGSAKVDAMAAVITELVSQREEMHQMMMERHSGAEHHAMNQPAHRRMMNGHGMMRGRGMMGTTAPQQPASSVPQTGTQGSAG
jgi:hypothetical protein